jgi:hypothetical protein
MQASIASSVLSTSRPPRSIRGSATSSTPPGSASVAAAAVTAARSSGFRRILRRSPGPVRVKTSSAIRTASGSPDAIRSRTILDAIASASSVTSARTSPRTCRSSA